MGSAGTTETLIAVVLAVLLLLAVWLLRAPKRAKAVTPSDIPDPETLALPAQEAATEHD